MKSKVPWLADVLKLLQEAQELSQDLIDKVHQLNFIINLSMIYRAIFHSVSGYTVQINGPSTKVEHFCVALYTIIMCDTSGINSVP